MSWAGDPYFTKKEMRCRCGCGGLPKDFFMNRLVTIREECGFPFIVTSGYRCAEYNEQVANSGIDGPHVQGLAADIALSGNKAYLAIKFAIKHGFTGIGPKQHGEVSKRFVHFDLVDRGSVGPIFFTYE